MKSSAYLPLFYKQPLYTLYYMNYPHSFLKKNLEPHTYGFSKISTPKRGEGSLYEPTQKSAQYEYTFLQKVFIIEQSLCFSYLMVSVQTLIDARLKKIKKIYSCHINCLYKQKYCYHSKCKEELNAKHCKKYFYFEFVIPNFFEINTYKFKIANS